MARVCYIHVHIGIGDSVWNSVGFIVEKKKEKSVREGGEYQARSLRQEKRVDKI